MTRAIRAVLTCGARTLSGLLHQSADDARGVDAATPKRMNPMTQKTTGTVVDGVAGGPIAVIQTQTVKFALDGQRYEIDLSVQNAADLRQAFQPYVRAGRQVSRGTGTSAHVRSRTPGRLGTTDRRREGNAAIREWARAHGLKVSDRGRIPSHVMQAYQAE